ncbi:adenylate/guanylate cyclase domain-containing protein [Ruegeria lacuscaerulensis]|uniref:adenylate/guanylate cyclase domain-containing protein n=1 Tax=Ruegeria lacuscaerulensis TaxID=55218 RepID=UPI00147EC07B|nr:adenylate/guanylate cyclase domain-containing protein [Ruegeria lacuscaerulensis]
MQRRLAAIMAADVVGYSSLMGSDETGVLSALKTLRIEIFDPAIARHHGRLVKLMGDGALVEFASVVDAVNCGVEIQRAMTEAAPGLANGSRLQLRIGINLGDVMIADGDLYGDGVNVASRIEGLADPGGVAVSESVAQQAMAKVDAEFEDLGPKTLKNIAEPVRVFRVMLDGAPASEQRSNKLPLMTGASVLVCLGVASLIAWWISFDHEPSDAMTFDEAALLSEPTGPTVAVLPFQNLSNTDARDLLAVGIGEDIIVELGSYQDLNVLSRQSTHSVGPGESDPSSIRQKFGADYVLEGSVRQVADRLRVTARLIDTTSGHQVWSGAYDESLTTSNILDVQLSITEKVASALGDAGGAIKRIHAGHARAKPPELLSSYECSLLRVGFLNRRDMQERVRGCIVRVVEDEPEYWRGWAQLAEALLTDVKLFTGLYPGAQDQKIQRAEEAARNAVSLNPYSARAHFLLALVLQIQRDLEGFFSSAETALALGTDRYLQGQIGYEFIWSGRLDLGAALVENAIALDPNAADPNWYQALAEYHFLNGDYETALKTYRKGAQPDVWWSVSIEVAILAELGPRDAAISARDRLYKIRPGIKIADIVWMYRRFARPDQHILPFVEAYKAVDMPEGRFAPLREDSAG